MELGHNRIGDKGAQAIGQALQTNQVKSYRIAVGFYYDHISYSLQTLTTLFICDNEMTREAKEFLREIRANKQNLTISF